jgi:hypothetical protein
MIIAVRPTDITARALMFARCVALAMLIAGSAQAQVTVLDRVLVTASPLPAMLGTADSASEGDVPRQQLEARPVYRPGELLETAPGLIVTQHSGEGKANQYFLRGFNLDHGTDLAITVDGMPVNMPTHGHGQGYADINWLMPELASGLTYRKGPYFADEGDFSSAGAVHIDYLDRLPSNLAELTAGSFGYARALAAAGAPLSGGTIIAAGELQHYDGPWTRPDDLNRFNSMLRYAKGDSENGVSLTGLAYGAHWNSTDQVAPSRKA